MPELAIYHLLHNDSLGRVIKSELGIRARHPVLHSEYTQIDGFARLYVGDSIKQHQFLGCDSGEVNKYYFISAPNIDSGGTLAYSALSYSGAYKKHRRNLLVQFSEPFCNTICCELRVYSGDFIGLNNSYYEPKQLFLFFFLDQNGQIKYFIARLNHACPIRITR